MTNCGCVLETFSFLSSFLSLRLSSFSFFLKERVLLKSEIAANALELKLKVEPST